jgi:hypothetical protein
LTPESQATEADDLSPNADDTYDFEGVAAGLQTLGFATWRVTAPSRKVDLLARHPDGTIVRVHRNKRLTVEFDYSNCDRFKNDAPAAKPVVEISWSQNWRWAICVWYFRVVRKIRSAAKQLRFRYNAPKRVASFKRTYAEPPTTEFEWRGWGL